MRERALLKSRRAAGVYVYAALAFLAGASCSGGPAPGEPGGKCYANNTCNRMIPCVNGVCAAGEGGAQDAPADGPKPNPCEGKKDFVYDDLATTANGFGLDACGVYMAVESAVEMDSSRAAQFITPLAGAKLPASKPYKFTWKVASFPNAPMPGTDPNKVNGIGYVVYFTDANTSFELLRLHTIMQSYTPDGPSWAKIVAASPMGPNPPTVQLKIVAAFFVDGKIADMNNPVTSAQPRLVEIDKMM